MPRRNRRSPQQARPIRTMSPERQRALRAFARDHLDEHAYAVLQAGDADLIVMTGSECPTTGVRFLSTGARRDPLALRLAQRVETSDAAGNLAI